MIKILYIALLSFCFQAFANERIVSISAFATEVLHELNLENQIVGVDLTSQFLPQTKKISNVGYKRTLSLEGILSLKPTIVIIDDMASPKRVVENLRNSGVKILEISEIKSISQMKESIATISQFFEVDSRKLLKKVENLAFEIQNLPKSGKIVAFISKHGGRIETSAGINTVESEIIKLIGGIGAFGHPSHRPLNKEAMANLKADYIIYSTTTKLSKQQKSKVEKRFDNKKVIFVQSVPLLIFGVGSLYEILQLSRKI